ncbi:MAG TPA: arsenate reductase ArsC [Methanobacteriaceae archaeon]|nr:arsenate reductase ArsC [Methanobacteriaceae archaeon]
MAKDNPKQKVLLVCIHNAARSQMAEAFFREFYGDNYDVRSAGSEPQEVDPQAIQVMAEIDIDISHQTSNSLNDYTGQEFDYVITICGNYSACPFFLGGKNYFIHPFEDPSSFTGPDEERLEILRRLRDEIGDWVQDMNNYQICDETCNGPNCCDLETNTDDDNPCC